MPDDDFELPEVVITGQRAKGPSPFSALNWPTTGSPSHAHQNQLEEAGPDEQPTDEQTQCADPEARKQWDADAKAAEAARRFREEAAARFGEPDLANREFGALICEMSDGAIQLSQIYDGPPILDENGVFIVRTEGRATVDIPHDACGSGIPVGTVHSHPGTNSGIPSNDDFGHAAYVAYMNNLPAEALGIYIVANYANGGQNVDAITRHSADEKDAANAGQETGTFINPDAEVCPLSE